MRLQFSVELIYHFLKKYGRWVLVLLFILLLSLNLYIYYKYVYLVVRIQPDTEVKRVTIRQEVLDKILKNITEREENLSRVKAGYYPDPFNR